MPNVSDIELVHATTGKVDSVDDLTTLFDLVLLVVDADHPELTSSILRVYSRIDQAIGDADVNLDVLVVGAGGRRAVETVGAFATRGRIFTDRDGSVARRLGVTRSPTLLWVDMAGNLRASVEGWDPARWRALVTELAEHLAWTRPLIPDDGDPPPFGAAPLRTTGPTPQ